MSWNGLKKKLSMGTVGLWVTFVLTTFVLIILMIANIFESDDYWIPLIPIGSLLILSIMASSVDLKSERRRKVGVSAMWAIFALTTVVMIALMFGVFETDEIWIPIIPIGSTFIIAIFLTVLEYASGNVRFCPKCGKNFAKKWDFCQDCGTRVLMTCSSCGIKLKGNPKFCHKCGINLSEVELVQLATIPSHYEVDDRAHFCHNCGGPSNPEAKFCGFCGNQH
jgi:hypothetical protein